MNVQTQALLGELRPNFEIIQIIKAADQLYYRDKTLYTEIKPEMVTQATNVKKEEKKQEQVQRAQKTSEGSATGKSGKKHKKGKGEKEKVNSSKLQEMIGQARKTVEEALRGASCEPEPIANHVRNLEQELERFKSENAQLLKKIHELESRIEQMEKVSNS